MVGAASSRSCSSQDVGSTVCRGERKYPVANCPGNTSFRRANSSPYDPEARYSTKRNVSWMGYKAHLTETCDPELPHVITNVEITPATIPDDNMLTVVHQS